jgi:hypothetical protein
LDEQGFKNVFARPADSAADVGVREALGPMASYYNPWSFGAAHGGQISCEPICLGAHDGVEGSGGIAFTAVDVIVADESVSEVGLGV